MEEIRGGCNGEVRRIHIVYFLCRDGKIDQPHLVRVHHLNRHGVHLRDVKRWLSELRGEDMPACFAWSYKRRYRGGFVWQDLTDDDLITAISDNEYVLKGSFIQDRESPIKEQSKERERQSKITPEAQQKEDDMLSFERMNSKDSLLRSNTWQKENMREEELKGLEKTVKKEKKLATDLRSDCGGGRKAANVMRNFIIGCKSAETKGSMLKEVRQEGGSLSEGSDNINCNKGARNSFSKTKEKQTTSEV